MSVLDRHHPGASQAELVQRSGFAVASVRGASAWQDFFTGWPAMPVALNQVVQGAAEQGLHGGALVGRNEAKRARHRRVEMPPDKHRANACPPGVGGRVGICMIGFTRVGHHEERTMERRSSKERVARGSASPIHILVDNLGNPR